MKKFIVIFILMLVTFVGNAQYINPNIRQDNTSPAQWNEWKGLMNQYNKSKGLIYGGLGFLLRPVTCVHSDFLLMP